MHTFVALCLQHIIPHTRPEGFKKNTRTADVESSILGIKRNLAHPIDLLPRSRTYHLTTIQSKPILPTSGTTSTSSMSTFHPTKRDLLLVLSCFLILGLFLQFDFSLRFDYSHLRNGAGRTYDDGPWQSEKAANNAKHAKFLEDVTTGAKASEGRIIAGMTEAKVKWGEEGAVRTEVLGHAPGKLIILIVRVDLIYRMDNIRSGVSVQWNLVHRHGRTLEHPLVTVDDFDGEGNLERRGFDQGTVSCFV